MNRFEQIEFLNSLDRSRELNFNRELSYKDLKNNDLSKEPATDKQLYFLKKNKISHGSNISKKDAMKKISEFKQKEEENFKKKSITTKSYRPNKSRVKYSLPKLERENNIPSSNSLVKIIEPASIKLKRFLTHHKIEFSNAISRDEAIMLIGEIGFHVSHNDEITPE